jgi:hypothetical protein
MAADRRPRKRVRSDALIGFSKWFDCKGDVEVSRCQLLRLRVPERHSVIAPWAAMSEESKEWC